MSNIIFLKIHEKTTIIYISGIKNCFLHTVNNFFKLFLIKMSFKNRLKPLDLLILILETYIY